MSYSIKAILNQHEDKNGEHKIIIQVIYSRIKIYSPTPYKVRKEDFISGFVKNVPNARLISDNLRDQLNLIEKKLLDKIRITQKLTKEGLIKIVKGDANSISLEKFVTQRIEKFTGKYSQGTIAYYKSNLNMLSRYAGALLLSDITPEWLLGYEKHLRGLNLSGNTIWSKMKFIKVVIRAALAEDVIHENPFLKYKVPRYVRNIPDYLTEKEVTEIFKIVKTIKIPTVKLSGYYFLLSCYTGYRISDAKTFDYKKMVSGESIILRAKKNKTIVSIPIHSRLAEVLKYIKDKPLTLSEQNVRDHVKMICKLAGITRNIKYHTSRHTWAMLLMSKGFTVDEVAETLGDTSDVAKIYARISNIELSKKIKERLK